MTSYVCECGRFVVDVANWTSSSFGFTSTVVDFLNGGLADLIYGGFSAYARVLCRSSTMTTYLVATLSIYVLVDAQDEAEARIAAMPLLYDQYANLRERLGRDVPINILTVRPAITAEITRRPFSIGIAVPGLMKWHIEIGQWNKRVATRENVAVRFSQHPMFAPGRLVISFPALGQALRVLRRTTICQRQPHGYR